ncbi:flagellar assembly protein FliH [Rheinheimera marina]|uniref:Flagellar assembly protein FliH n=1 Tax=Rheinheimera marina TaxID=1774958 RepID=A0ABV9JRN1_9GAMM
MTDHFRGKQPFEPDEELLELLKQWPAPMLEAEHKQAANRTNALYKTRPDPKVVTVTEEADELELKPLTAEDIEQIRQAAYDEGFAEGKNAGFGQGYQDGQNQGLQDGLKQGQDEGKKLGLEDAAAEVDAIKQQLAQLLDQLQQPLAQINDQVKHQLTELALRMAEAVIAVEAKTNPAVILQTVSDAVAVLPLQTEHVLIKLHPDDLAILQQHYTETELTQRHWQLRAEPSLEQGGCLIETPLSSIDRSMKQRLAASLEHFLHSQSQDPS